MSTDAGIVKVRGLCKVIGFLGGLYHWNDETRGDLHTHLLVHLRDDDRIRLVELLGHPELPHTEREHGKVDTYKLSEIITTECSPLQLLRLCTQILQERIGPVGTTDLPKTAYRKHIDERDEQFMKLIGRLDQRLRRVEGTNAPAPDVNQVA